MNERSFLSPAFPWVSRAALPKKPSGDSSMHQEPMPVPKPRTQLPGCVLGSRTQAAPGLVLCFASSCWEVKPNKGLGVSEPESTVPAARKCTHLLLAVSWVGGEGRSQACICLRSTGRGGDGGGGSVELEPPRAGSQEGGTQGLQGGKLSQLEGPQTGQVAGRVCSRRKSQGGKEPSSGGKSRALWGGQRGPVSQA